MKILKRLLVAMVAAGVVIAGPTPVTLAQTPAPQHAVLARLRTQLRDEIARMTNLSPIEIEVHATNAVIRVLLVNTVYNADPSSEREYLASCGRTPKPTLATSRSRCSSSTLSSAGIGSRKPSNRLNSAGRRTELSRAIQPSKEPRSTGPRASPAFDGEAIQDLALRGGGGLDAPVRRKVRAPFSRPWEKVARPPDLIPGAG